MKSILLILALGIGIYLGYFKGIDKPKPIWWQVLIVCMVTITLILTLLPPIAGSFNDSAYMSGFQDQKLIPVKFKVISEENIYDLESKQWIVSCVSNVYSKAERGRIIYTGKSLPAELKESNTIVAKLQYINDKDAFSYVSTVSVNPLMTFPYVPALEERIRILNLHVPMAWIAVVAYLVSMIYSILYLRKKDIKMDIKASSAAALGTLFTILATVTGMVWARFNWGAFWSWDPRQTSIFVLLLIYAAYFALRSAIDREDQRARLSSVYSILAFLTVPFLIFILPRITAGLHPGSQGEDTIGPVLSTQDNTLNETKQYIFSLSLASFTALYFWLMNLWVRIKNLWHSKSLSIMN